MSVSRPIVKAALGSRSARELFQTACSQPQNQLASKLRRLLPMSYDFSHFPFLNLPSEIRSLIYSMVLDTGETPIQIAHEQYSHHSFHPPKIAPSEGCQFCKLSKRPGITRFPISVLLVCSQIHHESHLLPYLLNTFVIYTSTLLGFVHARTPSQLRSLRSISLPGIVLDDGDHLSYSAWMLWEITDGLKSLKKLTLGLLILRGEVTLDGYADGYEGVGIWVNRRYGNAKHH